MTRYVFLCCALFSATAVAQSSPTKDLQALQATIAEGRVSTIDVVHLHNSTLTRVAVNPDKLKQLATFTAVFAHEADVQGRRLFANVSVSTFSHPSDLRWGVILRGESGQELGSVYVDKFGKEGYLNGQAVSFSADLASRLEAMLKP